MQTLLPLLPAGATRINEKLGVLCQDRTWSYFLGQFQILSHAAEDIQTFRANIAQLIDAGSCKQSEVAKAFAIPAIQVKRAVKKYRKEGLASFFSPRKGRGATVLTQEVLAEAQELLDAFWSRSDVAKKLGIKLNTLKKAIHDKRLIERNCLRVPIENTSNKSERSSGDAQRPMGTACTRDGERLLASLGKLNGASIQFQACMDLSFAGVLCAFPALESNGLFKFLDEYFELPKGYYELIHVVLTLAIMALCRIQSIEELRFESPGELGRLIGLDRIPEVKTLRKKIKDLNCEDQAQKWQNSLSKYWMEQNQQLAGVLYVDGHVRVYHGQQTQLPKRFVSRQKLCLRGVTDYYVNDALGQPFFLVSSVINSGMTKALEEKIIPQLLEDIPNQPTAESLKVNTTLHRFILVFDRECSSIALFKRLWGEHRIACISYQKNVKDKWSEDEFKPVIVDMPNGESIEMDLAERGTCFGEGQKRFWLKEVRKLTETKHQCSIISSAYTLDLTQNAAQMFTRWSQENFFAYMMKHYKIDSLTSYEIEEFPDPKVQLINPVHRQLEKQVNSLKGKLNREKAHYADCEIKEQERNKKGSGKNLSKTLDQLIHKKALHKENIDHLQEDLDEVKAQRKETPKHIKFEELPEAEQFKSLKPSQKIFMDTIKFVAYRAETVLANQVKAVLGKKEDARRLICDLMRSDANLIPDKQQKILIIEVHRLANTQADKAIEKLLLILNQSETYFPNTDWRLHYRLVTKSLQ